MDWLMKHIIEQNKKYIKAVIRKLTGSNNEDIEQEVYIKTWRNLPNYTENGKFKSWIATVTANVCKDYFKSSVYKQQSVEVSSDEVLQNKGIAASQEKIVDAKKRLFLKRDLYTC
jgi:RNA polymerase sigma-70 factor (ECF subfamily)